MIKKIIDEVLDYPWHLGIWIVGGTLLFWAWALIPTYHQETNPGENLHLRLVVTLIWVAFLVAISLCIWAYRLKFPTSKATDNNVPNERTPEEDSLSLEASDLYHYRHHRNHP